MASTQMGSITILTVNGRAFVSGLLWKPLRSARSYMAEAKAIGKREGMDMVAIRRGKVLQAGFAPRQPKGRRKDTAAMRSMYSLAAALAGVLGDDWCGAFALEDGRYAFIAVHKGGILPGRDLVGDQAEVEALLRETYSDISGTGVEPKIIAPESWSFGGDEETLETLLNPAAVKPDYRLKPLTMGLTPREIGVVAAVAVILVGGGVGGMHWWHQHREHQAEIARQQSLEAAKSHQKQMTANAAAAIVRPWVNTPAAEDFLSACEAIWSHVPLDIGGWRFDNGRCVLGHSGDRTKDGVFATYHRADSMTVADFQAAARALGAAPGIFDNGETGTVMLRLRMEEPTESPTEQQLPTTQDQLQALVTRLQSVPTGIASYTAVVVPWTPPPAPKGQPPLPAPAWQTYSLDVKTGLAPSPLFEGMAASGIRFYEIAVSLDAHSNLNWTVKGEMYGR